MKWTPERMLARLDGDRELAVQLAGIFLDEYPHLLQRLRDAVTARSVEEVRRTAHALKGSMSNFIDEGPTATAFELETLGRNGQLDGTQALVDRLDRELIALSSCLREFQSNGPG
jgi:HPt (histidine-containing phosphotransfer) domain-containing protein